MKRVLLLIIIIILCPMIVLADELEITGLELVEESSSAGINNPPEYGGLNIKLDHNFEDINSYIKYKVYIKNNLPDAYVLKFAGNPSNYISYALSNDTINGDSESTVYLTLTYANEYAPLNEIYNETNNVKISFVKASDKIATASFYIPFAIISFVIYSIFIFTKNRKLWYTSPLLGILLFGLYMVPISFAESQISLNSKINIIKTTKCESFATDSWEMIKKNIMKNDTACYHVGDEKEVTLNGIGTFNVRIANIESPKECHNYSESSCGFIFEFTDNILELSEENDKYYNTSSIRSYLNNEVYNSLPADLKNAIIDTNIISNGIEENETYKSSDKLFLLSNKEVGLESAFEKERTLDYYLTEGKVYKSMNSALRTYQENGYLYITPEGASEVNLDKESKLGISPAFKVN